MNSGIRISLAELHAFCSAAFERVGASRKHAEQTAGTLVSADAFGVFTHGTKLMVGYLRRIKAGGIRTDVEPGIQREGPGWGVVNGRSALGQVTGEYAMALALHKARNCGIAYVGVDYSNHYGAAGHYALMAARQGMIGLSVCNDTPSVAAPGSRGAVTGTNPIAYAIPAGDRDPIFFDAAISTVAGGKVYAARTLGQPIPPDWLIGPDGHPTTDGSLYPAQASLAPMSGHKGYGLALLVETLSSLATGAAMTRQVGSWMFSDPAIPTRHGAAFIALDVSVIAPPGEFTRRVQELIEEIHAVPTIAGVERVLLPGEREWASRRRAESSGIELPRDVVAKLVEASGEAEMTTPAWLS